jgi:hypothetical protein
MPRVRTGAANKWARRAGAATEDFKSGVENPRTDWAAATIAAAPSQAAGVQAAIASGRFQKAVAKSGTAKWKDKTMGKGADRFASGVAAAQTDYEQGIAPYTEVLNSVSLPARGAKGDPKNYDRVKAIGEALRKKKLSLS